MTFHIVLAKVPCCDSILHEARLPLSISTGKKSARRSVIVIALLLAILQIEGCYYMQAIRGQFEVMNSRRPIPDVIADEESPDELKNRLTAVQEARDFQRTC